MSGPAPVRAVCFDLDGTLCRDDQDGATLYHGAFEAAGVEPFGTPEALWAALEEPPDPDDPVGQLERGFAAVAADHGRSGADARALAEGFVATVDHTRVSFTEGAAAALESARDRLPVALVTNGPRRRQAVKLDALGIADAFDVTVFADDVERRKPHADPFERALAALAVPAGATLYVGDSLEYDVAGALDAGLQVAWVAGDAGADARGRRPTYTLASLADLPAVLDAAAGATGG